jgi:hypothetical protein
MLDDELLGRCKAMSFVELRLFIDSALNAISEAQPDQTQQVLGKEDFLELVKLLRRKSDTSSASKAESVPPKTLLSSLPEARKAEIARLERMLEVRQAARSSRSRKRRRSNRGDDDLRKLIDQAKSEELEAIYGSSDQTRFCDRIQRDVERVFTNNRSIRATKVYWRILPSGTWTRESILSHYSKIQRQFPHVQFDLARLDQMFALRPSSLYVGIDEFDGYIVFAFSGTKKVVLECPVYGNAIYVIRDNWESLSKLSKSDLQLQFADSAQRIVHAGDWFPRLRAELRLTGQS